jgi:hypothetical protein
MLQRNSDLTFNHLFRGRPYTKSLPFQFVLTGVAGTTHQIWAPVNAYFELGKVISRATVALDLALADTTAGQIIGFISPDATGYEIGTLDFNGAAFRSQGANNPKLLLVDGGVAGTVKGVAYGWEVTLEGDYR